MKSWSLGSLRRTTLAPQMQELLSILDVSVDELDTAIERVFDSYVKDRYVLIQYAQRSKNSGVCFSHDPNTGAPYNTLSWSDAGDTDSVTKGEKGHKTAYRFSNCDINYDLPMGKVFDPMQELAKLVGERPIDIPFETKEGQLYLLQLRQLITENLK